MSFYTEGKRYFFGSKLKNQQRYNHSNDTLNVRLGSQKYLERQKGTAISGKSPGK